MTDGIDRSQWLEKVFNALTGRYEQVPPVNAFRAQHGHVKWEGEAIKALTWMPDILNDLRLITDDHLHTCKSVERATLSAMAALGLPSIRVFIAGDNSTNGLPETDPFAAILKGMKAYHSTALLWVICDERNNGNIELARKMITTITDAIDRAQIILESLKDSGNVGSVASGVIRPQQSEHDPV